MGMPEKPSASERARAAARARWATATPAERLAASLHAAAAGNGRKPKPTDCKRCGAPCPSARDARAHCQRKRQKGHS